MLYPPGLQSLPHHHVKEAYKNATSPSPSESHNLIAFSDACWGGQFGNAVADGTPLELFKFRPLSGFVICRSAGPIAWKSIRQDQTAQSLCEAEILATNEYVKELLDVRNCAEEMDIPDAATNTPVYNDNMACVNWSASVTSKGTEHINLRENKVREVHADNQHVSNTSPASLTHLTSSPRISKMQHPIVAFVIQ